MSLDNLNLIQLKLFYQKNVNTSQKEKANFQLKKQSKYINKILSLIFIILFTILIFRINQSFFLIYLFLIFLKFHYNILSKKIQAKKDLKKKLQEEKKISENKAKKLMNLKQYQS